MRRDARPHVSPREVVAISNIERLIPRVLACGRPDGQVGDESRVGEVVGTLPIHLIRRHAGFGAELSTDEEVERVGECQVHAVGFGGVPNDGLGADHVPAPGLALVPRF